LCHCRRCPPPSPRSYAALPYLPAFSFMGITEIFFQLRPPC
jgi:hypothetical protein